MADQKSRGPQSRDDHHQAPAKPCDCLPHDPSVPELGLNCHRAVGDPIPDGVFCQQRARLENIVSKDDDPRDIGPTEGMGAALANADRKRKQEAEDNSIRDLRRKGKFIGFTADERALVAKGVRTLKKWISSIPGSRAEAEAESDLVDLIETVAKMTVGE